MPLAIGVRSQSDSDEGHDDEGRDTDEGDKTETDAQTDTEQQPVAASMGPPSTAVAFKSELRPFNSDNNDLSASGSDNPDPGTHCDGQPSHFEPPAPANAQHTAVA